MRQISDRRDLPIGVFDSGVGGISVLREAMAVLPGERFLFYGDTANAPYGEKPADLIRNLTLRATGELIARGVKALLVACNTATAAGISELRSRYDIPVLGMEPALKPAMANQPGYVVVMATPATLHLDKFCTLLSRFHDADRVFPLPCPGLARLIETGGPGSAVVADALRSFLSSISVVPRAIVLGCTHYSFIAQDIAALMPGTAIYDGNRGTALHLRHTLERGGLLCERPALSPRAAFLSSDGSANTQALWERFTLMDSPTIPKADPGDFSWGCFSV
ncbi:MAG: glutamate racemase [Clostridiales bacterium]|nr:glutamate racemase [Clostridiales bacterium]